mmetsp:Transcript_50058/g.121287  ORF Transcript_50058/g.121287 Transcript_50058/m.121287 type:complete len:99 (+) Transcript_50058:112-408(+)
MYHYKRVEYSPDINMRIEWRRRVYPLSLQPFQQKYRRHNKAHKTGDVSRLLLAAAQPHFVQVIVTTPPTVKKTTLNGKTTGSCMMMTTMSKFDDWSLS